MRKTFYKSRIIAVTIWMIALAVIVSVYPLRLLRRTIAIEGAGEPLVKSDAVNDERSAGQTFVARFNRLDSIGIYVASLEGGRYLSFSIRAEDGTILCERFTDMGETALPGYVTVPLGVDLEVNANYRITIGGRLSSYRIALEPAGSSPQLAAGFFYYDDDVVNGSQMRMRLSYNQPVSKGLSLILIALTAAFAALLHRLSYVWYRRHPEKNVPVLAGNAIRPPVFVLTGLFYAVLFVLNYPVKLFHDAPRELVFMGTGIVLACLMTWYAVYRMTGEEAGSARMPFPDIVMTLLLALTIAFCCEYMNGVTDAMHTASEKKILWCLGGILAVALLSPGKTEPARLNRYGWYTFATLAVLVVFRNTRQWVIVLTVFFVALSLYAGKKTGPGRWLLVARSGILLHFFGSVVYCLLFRAFQAFNFARYPFVFHTVTVTAEYMSLVCAVAAAGLSGCVVKQQEDASLSRVLRAAWKDMLVFGLSVSYALFTVSRVAALSVFVTLCLMFAVTGAAVFLRQKTHRLRYALRQVLMSFTAMLLAIVLVFPAAFTMQRVMPALVRHHKVFKGIEETWTVKSLLGYAEYDSPYYITIGRFASLFSVRFFGSAEGAYVRPYDRYNFSEDGLRPLYGINGVEFREDAYDDAEEEARDADEGTSAADDGQSAREQTGEHLAESSNGRLDIFRAYLKEIGMTGHYAVGLVTEEETYVHAHNTYLQAMYDFGIPAGLLFSAWIGVTILFGIFRYLCGSKKEAEGDKAAQSAGILHTVALTGAFAAASVAEWTFFFYNPVTVMLFMIMSPLMFDGAKHETGQP